MWTKQSFLVAVAKTHQLPLKQFLQHCQVLDTEGVKRATMFLEYIHGGEEGAVLGAWDVVSLGASPELMKTLIGNYKRGKFLQNVVTHALNEYHESDQSLKQAIAFKYQNFLLQRKFNLL